MKQGPEKTKFVKEPEEKTEKYIFQKNKKTKVGAIILIVCLVLLIGGILISKMFFTN